MGHRRIAVEIGNALPDGTSKKALMDGMWTKLSSKRQYSSKLIDISRSCRYYVVYDTLLFISGSKIHGCRPWFFFSLPLFYTRSHRQWRIPGILSKNAYLLQVYCKSVYRSYIHVLMQCCLLKDYLSELTVNNWAEMKCFYIIDFLHFNIYF